MNSIELHIGEKRKTYTLPAAWNELSREGLLIIAQAIQLQPGEAKLRILQQLSGIPQKLLLRLSTAQVANLTRLLDWIWLDNTLTRNLLPSLTAEKKTLYGPADSLKNMSWQEFIAAEKYFRAYAAQPSEEMLEYLIACLYRPASPDKDARIDCREDFSLYTIEIHRQTVRKCLPEEKLSVLFFFIGCYNEMKALYPFVFPQDDEFPEEESDNNSLDKKQTNTEETGRDWLDFIRTLPNDKFGTISEIEKSYVHSTLYIVDKMMEDAERQKSKTKIS